MTNITFIIMGLIISLFLIVALQFIPWVRIYKKTPYLLKNGFIQARGNFIVRLFILLLCGIAPVYVTMEHDAIQDSLPMMLMLVLCIGATLNIELQLQPQSKLVITKPLFSSTATLHLKTPYQEFDRQTYQELLTLVSTLPAHGVSRIKLTSPLFFNRKNQLRDLNLLRRKLTQRNAQLIHFPAERVEALLGKISMLLSRHEQKTEKLNQIDLHQWHTLLITLTRVIDERQH